MNCLYVLHLHLRWCGNRFVISSLNYAIFAITNIPATFADATETRVCAWIIIILSMRITYEFSEQKSYNIWKPKQWQ